MKIARLVILLSFFAFLTASLPEAGAAQKKTRAPAQSKTQKKKPVKAQPQKSAPAPARAKVQPARAAPHAAKPSDPAALSSFKKGQSFFKNRKWYDAAKVFYAVSRGGRSNEAHQAKYYLSLALYNLNLKQIAAFPLIDLIKDAKPDVKKVALDRLVKIANELGDTALLKYSLDKSPVEAITETAKELVYLRLGELAAEQGDLRSALAQMDRGLFQNPDNRELLYARGSIHLQLKDTEKALADFLKLYSQVSDRNPLERERGTVTLALARTYYQQRKWLDAIQWYREIPKDHEFFRLAQREIAWAFFRAGRFRSALGPLQSLTTPYYENFYDPETLVLRSIIYLFICKYDEMEKVISTFEKTYGPAFGSVMKWLDQKPEPGDGWNEMTAVFKAFTTKKGGKIMIEKAPSKRGLVAGNVPLFMMRSLMAESDINREIKYLNRLLEEQRRLERYSKDAAAAGLVSYGRKILNLRTTSVESRIGAYVITHLREKILEISDFQGQIDFLRYELLNDKREFLKGKISDQQGSKTVDVENSRDFYVQNGFHYYPFQGEFWRDEIGSYQYLGVNSCVQQ